MLDGQNMSILKLLCQARDCQTAFLSGMWGVPRDSPRGIRLNPSGDCWTTNPYGGEVNGHRATEKLRLDDLKKATIVNATTICDLLSPYASPRAGGNTNECTGA